MRRGRGRHAAPGCALLFVSALLLAACCQHAAAAGLAAASVLPAAARPAAAAGSAIAARSATAKTTAAEQQVHPTRRHLAQTTPQAALRPRNVTVGTAAKAGANTLAKISEVKAAEQPVNATGVMELQAITGNQAQPRLPNKNNGFGGKVVQVCLTQTSPSELGCGWFRTKHVPWSHT